MDKSLIIYEDADIMALNKPSGLIVNAARSHHQVSLQEQLADYLQLPPVPDLPPPDEHATPAQVFAFRQGLVHRLDKNTSGVLLWAKNPTALAVLLAAFRDRQVHKTYIALLHGLLRQPTGRINLPLARKRTDRQIMSVSPTGRPAITTYQVSDYFRTFAAARLDPTLLPPSLRLRDVSHIYQGFTLVSASPLTGRTHQLRAHFTHLGHPLVGDTAYLPRRKARLDPLWCPRQFLHAARIEFTHPTTGQPLTFTAPLPPDLASALTWLSA